MTSPGSHSSTLQMASSVEKRMAFTLPVLMRDMLTLVMPTLSARSPSDMPRLRITSSSFRTIAIPHPTANQIA